MNEHNLWAFWEPYSSVFSPKKCWYWCCLLSQGACGHIKQYFLAKGFPDSKRSEYSNHLYEWKSNSGYWFSARVHFPSKVRGRHRQHTLLSLFSGEQGFNLYSFFLYRNSHLKAQPLLKDLSSNCPLCTDSKLCLLHPVQLL